jgi:hypothetical protein
MKTKWLSIVAGPALAVVALAVVALASLPATLDPTKPADTDAISAGAGEIRAFRQLIVDFLGVPASPTSLTAPAFGITGPGVVTVSQAGFGAKDITLTRGTITTDLKVADSSVTWNAGGITFTAWKLNLTDTASAAASKLVDLQKAGVTQYSVDKNGATAIGPGATAIKLVLSTTASLNFTALAANSCEVLTVALTGAVDGDVVELGIPNALADVDGATERTTFVGWVSAAGTVSVRRCNVTGTITADPAAATVRVAVIQF